MRTLLLPPTIRTATPDELPNHGDVFERIAESHTANIVEGYAFHYNDTHHLPFAFFAEINVDNNRLWALFQTLLLQLPEEICIIYNFKDEEPAYSSYADKFEVLNQLQMFELELTQDGLLEIGVLYNDETCMEEVFIQSAKYLQYWGTDEERFRKTMAGFEIYEVQNLKFIDQYPLATEALRLHNSNATETRDVLQALGDIGIAEE